MKIHKRYDFERYLWALIIFLILSLGLFLRWQGRWYESGDFQSCLSLWMNSLEGKGLRSLSSYTGDYNMPYVTVLWLMTRLPVEKIFAIKGFSVLFDILCAVSCGLLAVECSPKGRSLRLFTAAFGCVFLCPVAVMNSGYWGQCDSVYVAFVLLACLCMLKNRFAACMILWGCAFAFKLQAIFAFPILLLYYWKNRKFSFLYFLLIPLTMEALCLPAILGGCSPWVTFTVYFSQMKTFPVMYYFYPNFWTYFQATPYYVFGKMAILGVFVLLALEANWILHREKELDSRNFLPNLLWMSMTMLCFLPCMHERYGYLLEMCSIVCAVIDWRKWWLALTLQAVTALMYLPGITGLRQAEPKILAIFYLAAYTAFSLMQIKRLGTAAALPTPAEETDAA